MCGPKKTTINNEVKEKEVMPAIDMKVADIMIGSTTSAKQAKKGKGTKQLEFTEVSKPKQTDITIKPVSNDIGYISEQQKKAQQNKTAMGAMASMGMIR